MANAGPHRDAHFFMFWIVVSGNVDDPAQSVYGVYLVCVSAQLPAGGWCWGIFTSFVEVGRWVGGWARSSPNDLNRPAVASAHTPFSCSAGSCLHNCSTCAEQWLENRQRRREALARAIPTPAILQEAQRPSSAASVRSSVSTIPMVDIEKDIGALQADLLKLSQHKVQQRAETGACPVGGVHAGGP